MAQAEDFAFLSEHDRHIGPKELREQIERERILIAQQDGRAIGWLRWNLFWDNTPFLNLLFLLEEHQAKRLWQAAHAGMGAPDGAAGLWPFDDIHTL